MSSGRASRQVQRYCLMPGVNLDTLQRGSRASNSSHSRRMEQPFQGREGGREAGREAEWELGNCMHVCSQQRATIHSTAQLAFSAIQRNLLYGYCYQLIHPNSLDTL